jgi:hypothetical protein
MVYQYIVSGCLLLWFVLTAIVQFRDTKFERAIKSKDALALLPLWTFFAPNPGVNDYHLLYREDNEAGERSGWQEVEINENRTLSTCVWNPSKRGKKVLSDVIQTIIPLIQDYKGSPKVIMFSVPYILILNAIMKENKVLDNSRRKQFLLTASNGYEYSTEPQVILLSEFHPIN